MQINPTSNPFTLQPDTRNLQLSSEIQRARQSQSEPVEKSQQSNRQLFSINSGPLLSSELSANRSQDIRSDNRPISQYLQTQNLNKRQELESLVGLDLFV